ncbi:MAG: pentapeptide repeat-containing protein [Solirubrobacteraceae bacterium]
MSRAHLLATIQNSPHAAILKLSASDLDLSSDAIEGELTSWSDADNPPRWYSEVTGGIRLSGWRLGGAHFDDSKVWRGDFANSYLFGASFVRSDAGVCRFAKADLSEADFSGATLSRADFRGATLTRTRFSEADLRDAVLTGAAVDHPYLAGATLANTRLSRDQFKKGLGEETDEKYRDAVSGYAALKANFRSLGLFEDASWAYLQERRMETKAMAPWRQPGVHVGKKLVAALRWIGGCLSGALVGYGERPLRAILAVPVIIAAYAALYSILGSLAVEGKAASLGACFRYSLTSFVTLTTSGNGAASPRSSGAEIWTSLEAMTGVSLIALVMFSLGRRITRS